MWSRPPWLPTSLRRTLLATDTRDRLVESGIQSKLSVLSERIARVVESPESCKAREREMAAAAAEAKQDGDAKLRENVPGNPQGASRAGASSRTDDFVEAPLHRKQGNESTEPLDSIELKVGPELDDLALGAVGALSAMLCSEKVKSTLSESRNHLLEVLMELATIAVGRCGET